MKSEELRAQLAHETQVKHQSIEASKSALISAAETLRKNWLESAHTFSSSFRDAAKEAEASQRRTVAADREKWDRTCNLLLTKISEMRWKLLILGPAVSCVTVLAICSLIVVGARETVSRVLRAELSFAQQAEVQRLNDLRAQVLAMKEVHTSATKALETIRQQTAKQAQLLEEATKRSAIWNTFRGRNGETFIEIPLQAQPQQWEGRRIIQIKTNP
jgi:hypothetical protein